MKIIYLYQYTSFKAWKDINGRFHREDGPAVLHNDGDNYWYHHGILHRIDGPAREWNDAKEWYLNGTWYPFEDWLKRTPISIEEKTLLKLRYG